MAKMESVEDSLMSGQAQAQAQAQLQVYKLMFAFADSMALKCAVELRVPDIIHSHGGQATLSQIASSIGGGGASAPGAAYLARIMRLLVRNEVFSVQTTTSDDEPVYGLTDVSRWLLVQGSPGGFGLTLAPNLLFINHPEFQAPWHLFSQSAVDGGSPFEKAHGHTIWELVSKSPDLNKVFNDGLACTTPIIARGIRDTTCNDVFGSGIGTLVDVGGGVGAFLAEIIKLYPHIKRAINYDLPHVICTAPQWEGVTHVAGNMFEAIPEADAIVMKGIFHDWGDEDCVKILKNCRKSIERKSTGKLIIIDTVIEPEGEDPWDGARLRLDLLMLAHCIGGMERTKQQWKNILEEGGFPNHKIFRLPNLFSVIEAYPA